MVRGLLVIGLISTARRGTLMGIDSRHKMRLAPAAKERPTGSLGAPDVASDDRSSLSVALK